MFLAEQELNAVVHVELEPIVKLNCRARQCVNHLPDMDHCNYKTIELDENGNCACFRLSEIVRSLDDAPLRPKTNQKTKFAKIKIGSVVGQDFSYFVWKIETAGEYVDTVFEVEEKVNDRYKLTAKGFGKNPGNAKDYGSGALYVDENDLILE